MAPTLSCTRLRNTLAFAMYHPRYEISSTGLGANLHVVRFSRVGELGSLRHCIALLIDIRRKIDGSLDRSLRESV